MKWKKFVYVGLILCIILVILNVMFVDSSEKTKKCQESRKIGEHKDGAYALSILAKDLNVSIDPDRVAQFAKMSQSESTIMDNLADAVKHFGLKAVVMKISIKELLKIKRPVIARVKYDSDAPNHFVVIEVLGESIYITEPYQSSKLLTKEEFDKIWEGNILFVSKSDVKPPNESPHIDSDKAVYDFGQAGQLEVIEHTFVIKNGGQRELKINRIETQCSCTATLLSKKTLQPGENAQIKMTFMTESRRGRQVTQAIIYSNDPDRPVFKLTMTGVVAGVLNVAPSNIYLGSVRNTSEIQKRIKIYDPGHSRLKIKSVKATASYIKTMLQPSEEDRIVAEVIVKIEPKMSSGKLREKIIITSNDRENPKTEVLVEGEVIGNLQLAPNQLFFGIVKPGTSTKRVIRMTDYTDGAIKIKKIESLCPYISITSKSTQMTNTVEIEVSFKAPISKTGIVKDSVKIYTTDNREPMIDVPLYAIIE